MNTFAYGMVVVGILIAKSFGFLREIVFASVFGANEYTDIYFQVFGVASFVFTGIGGALATLVIKNLNKPQNVKRQKEYVSSFIMKTAMVVILATLALYAFAKPILMLLLPGLRDELSGMALEMMYIMLPSCLFVIVAYIISGVLQNCRVYFITSVMSLPYNILIIGSLFFKGINLHALSVLTTLGWVAHLLILLPGFYKKGYRIFGKSGLKGEGKNKNPEVLYIFISSMMFQICFLIDKSYASFSGGAATTINYATNLFITISSIFVVAMSNVAYPSICRNFEEKNEEFVRKIIQYIIIVLFAIFVPIVLTVSCFGQNLIEILYQRGEFTPQLTKTTATLLAVYTFGIFGYVCQEFFNKILYLDSKYKYTVIGTLAVILLKIIVNIFAVKYFGIIAIAVSTTVLFSLYAVNIGIAMAKTAGNYITKDLIKNILKILLSGGAALLVFFAGKAANFSVFSGKFGFLILLLCCGAVYITGLAVTGEAKQIMAKQSMFSKNTDKKEM